MGKERGSGCLGVVGGCPRLPVGICALSPGRAVPFLLLFWDPLQWEQGLSKG